ncbi:hypothetical protein BMMON2_53390 [Burkholderia mallei]
MPLHARREAARFFSDNIQVGMVGINVPLPVPVAYHSFAAGSARCSAICTHTDPTVRFYTKRKTITQRWPSAGVREDGVQLPVEPLSSRFVVGLARPFGARCVDGLFQSPRSTRASSLRFAHCRETWRLVGDPRMRRHLTKLLTT